MLSFLNAMPPEVATGLIGAGAGAVTKIVGVFADLQGQLTEAAIRKSEAADKSADAAAARTQDSGGRWTRRAMALMSSAFLFGIPFLLIALYAAGHPIPTNYLYNQQEGFAFWGSERLYSAEVFGVVITPVHTHLATLAWGFYFGAGTVARGRKR